MLQSTITWWTVSLVAGHKRLFIFFQLIGKMCAVPTSPVTAPLCAPCSILLRKQMKAFSQTPFAGYTPRISSSASSEFLCCGSLFNFRLKSELTFPKNIHFCCYCCCCCHYYFHLVPCLREFKERVKRCTISTVIKSGHSDANGR